MGKGPEVDRRVVDASLSVAPVARGVGVAMLMEEAPPHQAAVCKQRVEVVALGAVVEDLDDEAPRPEEHRERHGCAVVPDHRVGFEEGARLLRRSCGVALPHNDHAHLERELFDLFALEELLDVRHHPSARVALDHEDPERWRHRVGASSLFAGLDGRSAEDARNATAEAERHDRVGVEDLHVREAPSLGFRVWGLGLRV